MFRLVRFADFAVFIGDCFAIAQGRTLSHYDSSEMQGPSSIGSCRNKQVATLNRHATELCSRRAVDNNTVL